ncbi:MAG: arsenate reductase ArsC [Cellvibrio sp.]
MHPLTLRYLKQAGIATDHLQSQSWDEFKTFSPDVVITLCDSAAGETCPVWFDDAIKLHWGLDDPSKLSGSDADIEAAFLNTMGLIRQRVELLVAVARTDRAKWAQQLNSIV